MIAFANHGPATSVTVYYNNGANCYFHIDIGPMNPAFLISEFYSHYNDPT